MFERVVRNLSHKEFGLPWGTPRSGIEVLARRGVIARLAQGTSREEGRASSTSREKQQQAMLDRLQECADAARDRSR